MPRVLLILALVLTAFWVFAIVDCAVQPPTRHRGVSKPIWILIVLLLPVLGGVLWLVVGRVRASAIAARRAPDDDPEFLGKLGVLSDQDERIRRLEEELAQLDAEGDDPRWTPPSAAGPSAPASGSSPSAAGPSPAIAGPDAPAAPHDAQLPAAPHDAQLPADGDDDGRGQRGAVS